MADAINNGILNDYTIKPRNLTQYKAFRGVTDFTQIGQFAQYERGYSFLSVLQMPKFMTELANKNKDIKDMVMGFQHMLEFEFRGLEGLPDLNADVLTITDGINEQRLINKVTEDTSATVTMQYFEKTGSLITKFSDYYLTGIKDPKSQAKTYHGLIKNGLLAPGPENEVFTMLYYVTDSTMLRLEKAYLLCNCQLTKAERSMYNGTRSDIGSNMEMSIEFNCYPISGYEVDKAAKKLLEDINGVAWNGSMGQMADNAFQPTGKTTYDYDYSGLDSKPKAISQLDSADYKYAILDPTIDAGGVPRSTILQSALSAE